MTGVVVMTCRADSDLAAAIFKTAVLHARTLLPDLPLIVVDDCSPNVIMRDALVAWDQDPVITVLRMGPPVASGFYVRVGCISGESCSFGHAPSLDRGLWYAHHHLKHPWALVLDGDVILLADDIQQQVRAQAGHLSAQVPVIGEWFGTPVAWKQPHTADAVWHQVGDATERVWDSAQKGDEPVPSAIRSYGYVNLMCSLVNLETFWDPQVSCLMNTGWVANQWFYGQMAQGRTARYWPVFRSEAAVHIGAVAIATMQGETFGNMHQGRRYGQRDEGNYYAGYLQVVNLVSFTKAALSGDLMARHQFRAPELWHPPTAPPTYLRYGTTPDALHENQTVSLHWVERATQRVLAQAKVVLEGSQCRIASVEGGALADEQACYEEVFEHTPAFQRQEVWTPRALVARLGNQRASRAQDDWQMFSWGHFSRGEPQYRWADHYGWARYGRGPLEAPTR